MVFGQTVLGRLSDRFGRRPIIALGFGLNLLFYLGLVLFEQFSLVFAGAVIAGLGGALLSPALSAFYLDITAEQHRSRVMGLKESAAALGGVIGPLLVAVASYWLTAQNIFLTSAFITLVAVGLTLVVLQVQGRVPSPSRPGPVNREVTSATGPASSPS
jgi:MFS family permease